MKFKQLVLSAGFFFLSLGCSVEDEATSTLLSSPTDNVVAVRFQNNCDVKVKIGRMGSGDFASLSPGNAYERRIGSDSLTHPSYAFYAYRINEHPGFGNMSLAEFTFNPNGSKQDFYDVSYVDAFNIPMTIRPANNGSCPTAGCKAKLNLNCPAGNRIHKDGKVIACSKFGDRDTPNNPAAAHFERHCPEAYSWSKDDWATKGCFAQDYIVTLCPK